jgi:hypothetical protein
MKAPNRQAPLSDVGFDAVALSRFETRRRLDQGERTVWEAAPAPTTPAGPESFSGYGAASGGIVF